MSVYASQSEKLKKNSWGLGYLILNIHQCRLDSSFIWKLLVFLFGALLLLLKRHSAELSEKPVASGAPDSLYY